MRGVAFSGCSARCNFGTSSAALIHGAHTHTARYQPCLLHSRSGAVVAGRCGDVGATLER
eukprot:9339909-Pyramimonas_sp.AAC.1